METKYKIAIIGGIALLSGLLLYRNRNQIATTMRNTINGSYFTISELCYSTTATQKGINNSPSEAVKNNLQKLITNCLDPIREAYGSAITVSSGYRCPELNATVGGVSNSQHVLGMAADLVGSSRSDEQLMKIFEAAIKVGNYDQLIIENAKGTKWVHVSYNPSGNRKQMFSYKGGVYTPITAANWKQYV